MPAALRDEDISSKANVAPVSVASSTPAGASLLVTRIMSKENAARRNRALLKIRKAQHVNPEIKLAIEVKPLFRPDVLRPRVKSFQLPDSAVSNRGLIQSWAELLAPKAADRFKEQELLPDFLTDVFTSVLGYARPTDNPARYTISREQYVEVDGKFALLRQKKV